MTRIAVAITLALAVSALFAVAPVHDAATLQEVTVAHLARPPGYLAFAPLSAIFDTLTLISARQHIALFLGLIASWVLVRFSSSRGKDVSARRDLLSFGTLLCCIFAVYSAALLAPRPMAYLTPLDPDVVRVDFHSHTNGSSDAPRTYSVEDSREWHRAGGYDVAYVTDHRTVAEAERGLMRNGPPGSGRTILLPGIEADWNDEHVGLLGSSRSVRSVLTPDLRTVVPEGIDPADPHRAPAPLLIWNHPRDAALERLPLAATGILDRVRAIEVANGAPHSLDLIRPKRDRIVALAQEHDLAMTSGTDNHGWAYAAPNWTLVRVKDWRQLEPAQLAERIEQSLREGGAKATQVVERTTADPGASPAALAFSVFAVPWRMLTTLSVEERGVWLLWTWGFAALAGRRRNPGVLPGRFDPVPDSH